MLQFDDSCYVDAKQYHLASFSTRNSTLNTSLRKPIRMQDFIQLCDSIGRTPIPLDARRKNGKRLTEYLEQDLAGRCNISNTSDHACVTTFSDNEKRVEKRCTAEYFRRTLRCLEMWSNFFSLTGFCLIYNICLLVFRVLN